MATEMGARMAQLEAVTRLATLHRGTNRESATRTELRELLATFTEGFTAPQLIEAQAILEERSTSR
jgi:hypothetical protein